MSNLKGAYMGELIQGRACVQRNVACIKSQTGNIYQVTEKYKTCIKSTVKHEQNLANSILKISKS